MNPLLLVSFQETRTDLIPEIAPEIPDYNPFDIIFFNDEDTDRRSDDEVWDEEDEEEDY